MPVNGVNVFINFFLLHILILSKVCFPKMLLQKISFLFVFNSVDIGGIYSTNTGWKTHMTEQTFFGFLA